MRVRIALLALIAIVSALCGAAGAQAAGVLSGTEQLVTGSPGDQYDPAISGNIVVFTDYRAADTDVYYVDLATNVEHPVIVAPGNQELTGVSGSRIVYTDYRTADVVLYDIATGTTTNLTRADKDAVGHNFNSVDPAISGDLVAWEDSRDGNMEIYAMNLATGEERRVTDVTDVDSRPSVSGSVIVWQRCAPDDSCAVEAYDWATGETRLVASVGSNYYGPTTDGVHVVYQVGAWGTGIDGNRVVYTDDRTGDLNIDMFTFQLQQSDTTPPTITVPLRVNVDATGPGGAVAGYSVTVTDDTDPAPALSCAPASGSLFAVGDTTVSCTATDASGNTATASFSVHVAGAAEQLAALRSHVASLGLRRLAAASLDAELRLAQAALAAGRPKLACASLALFESEVRVLPPSAINSADAADLVASARKIRAVLGC